MKRLFEGFIGDLVVLALVPALALMPFVSACELEEPEDDPVDLVTRADAILSKGVESGVERSRAFELYERARAVSDGSDFVVSHTAFGVGVISLFNLVETIVTLVTVFGSSDDGGKREIEFDLSKLAPLISALNEGSILPMLDEFKAVGQYPEFAFTFESGRLFFGQPVTNETDRTVMLDFTGEVDFGEIGVLHGVIGSLSAAIDFIFAYNRLADTALEWLLAPDVSFSGIVDPEAFFNQSMVVSNPLLDPDFGVMVEGGDIQALLTREKLIGSIGALNASLVFMAAEKEEGTDENDAYRYDTFVSELLADLTIVESGNAIIELAETEILTVVEQLLLDVEASIDDRQQPLNVNKILEPYLPLVEQFITLPDDLVVPAIALHIPFTTPYRDLKEVVPYFARENDGDVSAGEFYFDYEQESYTDDDGNGEWNEGEAWDDTGVDGYPDANSDGVPDDDFDPTVDRLGEGDGKFNDQLGKRDGTKLPPLGHLNPVPEAGNDLPNDVVDPLYIFLPHPDMRGMVVPVDPDTKEVDASQTFKNRDVNALISTFVTLLSTL